MTPAFRRIIALALATLGMTCGARADSAYRANQEGLRLFREGKFAEAQGAFGQGLEQAGTRVEDAAVLAYNQGLASLNVGAMDNASASFAQALGSPDAGLRAKAAYAAGNAWVKKAGEGGEEAEALQQSIAHLDTAMDFFEKALEADPRLVESSANHELAQTRQQAFKKKLEELKKKEEEQKKDDPEKNKDEEKKEQEKKEQEKKDQEKKDQEKQDSQKNEDSPSDPEQEKKKEEEKKEEEKKAEEKEKQEQEKSEEQKKNEQQQKQQEGKEGKEGEEKPGQPGAKPNEMSAEQAQMLLNAMMNDEKQQREAIRLKLMKAGPDIPVEKDY